MCSICFREIPASATMGRCEVCHAGDTTTPSTGWPDSVDGEPPAGDGAGFGRYVLGPRLGSGAMGVVYKVRDPEVGRDVALKMLHGGQYATTLALSLFQEEIKVFARLDHPHVVPIYEAGEHASQLYFTMKLLASDLKSQLKRFAGDPAGAAALVEKIALAVRHLHQHGILHRDLKPANILLDAEDPPNPYVADFGVAKRIGEDGQVLRTSMVVGTPAYMAPEQAAGKDVTWAADVYSLGVILYELLVQKLPFEGNAHQIAQAKQNPPKDPHVHDPRVDRDLARICLRCIEKEPEHRYPSAVALAIALQRYLNGEPYEGASRARRAWRWCLRHSLLTGLLTGILLLLVLAVVVVGEQQTAKTVQIRAANKKSAAIVAGSVLAQFRSLSDAVARAAADESLVRALAESTPGEAQQRHLEIFCEKTYTYFDDPIHHLNVNGRPPFHLWFVLDNAGIIRAQYSETKGNTRIGAGYEWRDYFIGARNLAMKGLKSVHISRAFKSESDGHYKFAFSSPIYSKDGRPAGVLVAGIESTAYLGSIDLDETQSIVVLVGPQDRGRYEDAPESPYVILRHPAFTDNPGEAVGMTSETVRQVVESGGGSELGSVDLLWPGAPTRGTALDGYRDPVAETHGGYAGSWSAGFAPVGNTGFVVIVQSREEEALKPELALARQMATWTVISAIPGVLFVVFAGVYNGWLRRRRSRRRSQAP